MYYDDILGFIFSLMLWDIVLYILVKFAIDQYENYILVAFHQTPIVHIFPSYSLYISNMLPVSLPSLLWYLTWYQMRKKIPFAISHFLLISCHGESYFILWFSHKPREGTVFSRCWLSHRLNFLRFSNFLKFLVFLKFSFFSSSHFFSSSRFFEVLRFLVLSFLKFSTFLFSAFSSFRPSQTNLSRFSRSQGPRVLKVLAFSKFSRSKDSFHPATLQKLLLSSWAYISFMSILRGVLEISYIS